MICTNCYYRGEPKTITKGSIWIEIALWLFFLLPGIIYSVWRLATRTKACPSCGQETLIPEESVRGQELVKKRKLGGYDTGVNKTVAKKNNVGCLGVIIAVFIIALFIAIPTWFNSLTNKTPSGTVQVNDSDFKSISYSVVNGQKRYLATFFKEIAIDDEATMGKFIGKAITYSYGIGSVINPSIDVVAIDNVNYFSIKSGGSSYLVLPLKNKENTRIFGINFWKQ